MHNNLGFMKTFDNLHWKSYAHLSSGFIDFLCDNFNHEFTYLYGCDNELCLFLSSDDMVSNGVWTTAIYYNYINNSVVSDTWLVDANQQDFVDVANSFYATNVFFSDTCQIDSGLSQRVLVSRNNYEDLVYSNEPSEIIISCLYIFIPVLLFIIGLKVFKKGLFR